MSVKAYFKNIYDNVSSIAIGMKITIKYCFQKTVTVQYPEQHLTFAPRYRGIHEFELEKCIACDMCAKACPVDYSKCLFCALCTEPCPTDCIHMGKLHDLSSYSREDVVVEFQDLDKKGMRTPMPLWMERNEKQIPWVAKEYARVKQGQLSGSHGD